MDLHLPTHPHTGLTALGFVGGRPVWPCAGGAPDDGAGTGGDTGTDADKPDLQADGQAGASRPEGITDEEWAALGDPGKRAIERERRANREAQRVLEQTRRELAEARKPATQQHSDDKGKGSENNPDKAEQPDVAAIVEQAVAAALRPFQEQQAATAAQRVQDRAQSLAAALLHNAADAVSFLELSKMVTATGDPDEQAIRDGLAQLVEDRPYLAKPTDGRRAAPGSGQGAGAGGGQTIQQRVQAQLDLMKAP